MHRERGCRNRSSVDCGKWQETLHSGLQPLLTLPIIGLVAFPLWCFLVGLSDSLMLQTVLSKEFQASSGLLGALWGRGVFDPSTTKLFTTPKPCTASFIVSDQLMYSTAATVPYAQALLSVFVSVHGCTDGPYTAHFVAT